MCNGVSYEEYGVRVRDGIATLTHGIEEMTIPIVILARLYREGMAQHRREKSLNAYHWLGADADEAVGAKFQ